jgi:hypothetical protein
VRLSSGLVKLLEVDAAEDRGDSTLIDGNEV